MELNGRLRRHPELDQVAHLIHNIHTPPSSRVIKPDGIVESPETRIDNLEVVGKADNLVKAIPPPASRSTDTLDTSSTANPIDSLASPSNLETSTESIHLTENLERRDSSLRGAN
jgi:hypothetical protein